MKMKVKIYQEIKYKLQNWKRLVLNCYILKIIIFTFLCCRFMNSNGAWENINYKAIINFDKQLGNKFFIAYYNVWNGDSIFLSILLLMR